MALAVPQVGGFDTSLTGGAAVAATYGSSTTSGSLLVAIGHLYNTSGVLTNGDITDNKSNTWTLRGSSLGGASAVGIGIWDQVGGTRGATHTVTLNLANSSADIANLAIIEITGADASTPFDATTLAFATDASSPYSVTSAAAISGNQIALYGASLDTGANTAFTQPTGYSDIINQPDGAFNVSIASYKINETGTPSPGATSSHAPSAAREVFATYKEAGGGGNTGTIAVTTAAATMAASGATVGHIWASYVKEVGFVTNTSAGSTSAITVAAGGVPVGDVIVIHGACDNTGSSGAATTIAVADNHAGTTNVYTLQTAQAIADPGSASAGQQGFFVVCPVTTALDAGDTITVTYGNSTTAKAICAQQWHNARIKSTVLSGTYTTQDNQTGQAVSVSATPTQIGQVVCTLVAVEGGTADSFTEDSDTTGGAWVTLTRRGSGTTTSGSTLNSAYKIVTATGAQTYGGTTMLGTSRDHCAAILVLNIPVQGSASVTTAASTVAASGAPTRVGTIARSTDAATMAASGTVGTSGQTGTIDIASAASTVAAAGAPTRTGTCAVTTSASTVAAAGKRTHVGTVTVTTAAAVLVATDVTNLFVTAVSASARYLVDQLNDAYWVQGISPQNMVPNGTLTEMDAYLSAMHDLGFNSAQVHLVYNYQADAETSTPPFGVDSTFASPGANYWATVDSMFDLAEQYGFTLWATVIDNISCGSTVQAATDANCFAYGQFLGARYKDRPGLVWVVGNDFDSSTWTARNPKYKKIIDGIRDQGDTHLCTVWNNTNAGNENTGMDGYQTVDNGYRYDEPPYYQTDDAYALTRTGYPMPFVWFEGTYYGEHNAAPGSSPPLELRKLALWGSCWGGVGHFFGTAKTWVFDTSGSGWISETSAAIYDHMQVIAGLFAGLTDWELAVPDTSHVFQTGGRGTFEGGSLDTDTFSTAAYVPSGTHARVYFPTSRGSITFDTTKLSGTVTAYWLDPTDGSTSTESNPAAPTHPGNNTGGDPDWLLIFEGTATGPSGTIAVTTSASSIVAAGAPTRKGTVTVTTAASTVAASGAPTRSGSIAISTAVSGLAASGTVGQSHDGTIAVTTAAATVVAAGKVTHLGTIAVTTAAAHMLSSANPEGTIAVTTAMAVMVAAGAPTRRGTIAVTTATATVAAAGKSTHVGTIVVSTASASMASSGQATITGTVTITTGNATMAAVGAGGHGGTIAVATAAAVLLALAVRGHVGTIGLATDAATMFAREAEAGPFGATSTGSHRLPSTSGTHHPPSSTGGHQP
jgi:hypothetical protein